MVGAPVRSCHRRDCSVRGLGAGPGELLDQLALAFRQPLRELGMDLGVEVAAASVVPSRGMPWPRSRKTRPSWRARRDRQRQRSSVGRRHPRLATEEERLERRADLRVQVVAAALEARIGRDRDDEIEVAGRPAALARTALAADADARAGPDAGWDLDLEAPGLAVGRAHRQLDGRAPIGVGEADLDRLLEIGARPVVATCAAPAPPPRPAPGPTAGPEAVSKKSENGDSSPNMSRRSSSLTVRYS